MILIENVKKKYVHSIALKGVSLKIEMGERFGILGPNGAGKTTLLKVILGRLKPDEGIILISDNFPSKDTRRTIGYLPEDFSFPDFLKVKEIINFYTHLKRANLKQVKELIVYFGIEKILNKELKTLSQGQKRLTQLILSLIGENEILIWDEPTVFIDIPTKKRIINFLENSYKKCTLIISSHILSEVEKLCERVCFLREGRVIKILNKEEFKNFNSLEEAFEKIANV